MPSNQYTIKQGATYPSILTTCGSNKSGGLNGASVNFRMMDTNKAPVLDIAATIVDPDQEIVSYTIDPSQTATPGTFFAEFIITFSDNSIFIAPDSGWIVIHI